MENIQRTVVGGKLQTELLLGLPFKTVPLTTLNEKFGIEASTTPAAGTWPKLGYFVIGDKGHTISTDSDGTAVPTPVPHQATDCALYNHLPFVLRDPSADLTAAQRANYCLRKFVNINGTRYVAYYGKRFSVATVSAIMQYVTVNGDQEVVTDWTPTSSNLNPTPPDLSNDGVNVIEGDYVNVSALCPLILNSVDRTELMNVALILYGKDDRAIISELGVCSGLDKTVSAQGPGSTTFDFVESIATQIHTHINTFIPMKYASEGISEKLDIGATDPLFVVSNTGTATT